MDSNKADFLFGLIIGVLAGVLIGFGGVLTIWLMEASP